MRNKNNNNNLKLLARLIDTFSRMILWTGMIFFFLAII